MNFRFTGHSENINQTTVSVISYVENVLVEDALARITEMVQPPDEEDMESGCLVVCEE